MLFLYSPQMTIITRRIAKAFEIMNDEARATTPAGAPAGAPSGAPHGNSAPFPSHASAPAPSDSLSFIAPYAQQVLDSLQKELKNAYNTAAAPGFAAAPAPVGAAGIPGDAWSLMALNMAASVLPQIPRIQVSPCPIVLLDFPLLLILSHSILPIFSFFHQHLLSAYKLCGVTSVFSIIIYFCSYLFFITVV